MHALTTALVVVAACGASPPASTSTPPQAPEEPTGDASWVETYCPKSWLGPWKHELFPACPPLPFRHEEARICDGECAKPCEMLSFATDKQGSRKRVTREVFTYDARGRLVALEATHQHWWESYTCEYAGEHLAACRSSSRMLDRAHRDERGRITRLELTYDRPIAVSYDAAGRVSSVGDDVIHYDEDGRLARITSHGPTTSQVTPPSSVAEVELVRNVSGRMFIVRFPANTQRYSYDSDDRVVKIVDQIAHPTFGKGRPLVETTEYTYRGDRLVRAVRDGASAFDREYRYDCPKPFVRPHREQRDAQ